jgi:hypothetical protein
MTINYYHLHAHGTSLSCNVAIDDEIGEEKEVAAFVARLRERAAANRARA